MSRVRVIDLDDLDDLPSGCRGCLFWQTAQAPVGRKSGDPQGQDAWWRAVQLDWGTPAKGIWDGDRLVAYALFAPPEHFGRLRGFLMPASDDALVLATMWTAKGHRAAGHARHLLQVLARDAIAHDHAAIEAYGSTSAVEGECVLHGDFLEALGFVLHRPRPAVSLYRLDLDRTVSWPHAVGHALGEVLSTLQGRERARGHRPALETTGNQANGSPSKP